MKAEGDWSVELSMIAEALSTQDFGDRVASIDALVDLALRGTRRDRER